MHSKAAQLPTYNQVTKHNLASIQPIIVQLLKHASFIALDAEFTGLGTNLAATRSSDIEERYRNLCNLAKSHALVAFGLSIFILDETRSGIEHGSPERAYKVHNFNFSMLAEKDYMVSPRSMLFLAENGLDLNQWILEGIPYTGGNRLTNEGGRGNSNGIMRSIFKRIMSQHVPVVVHNGFLDLIFLYHSFYADLPPKLGTFIADLSDMFQGGLYDTKYVSDYITREKASFLAYLFRKYERHDTRAKADYESRTSTESGTLTSVEPFATFGVQNRLALPSLPNKVSSSAPTGSVKGNKTSNTIFCEDYAGRMAAEMSTDFVLLGQYHGVCKKNMNCGKSHDLDVILDAEEAELEGKRNKRRKTVDKGSTGSESNEVNNSAAATSEADQTMSDVTQNGSSEVQTDNNGSSADAENARSDNSDKDVTKEDVSREENPSSAALSSTSLSKGPVETSKRTREEAVASNNSGSEVLTTSVEKFHSAYFDAFMTGTIFAHQMNVHGVEPVEHLARSKVYLIGKTFPLNVEKSIFTDYSPEHKRQHGM
ncbi:Target of EGR1, member 1 (Nuclear) [Podila epigama]|nr:Target of EGR1, member 1 (Nuclear) [Podila epigama]